MLILQDTREQKKLFNKHDKIEFLNIKLNVGDYTTLELGNKVVIDRKEPGDLYKTLIQDHDRFRREIMLSKELGVELHIFVECPFETFIRKRWSSKSQELQTPEGTLRKIVETMSQKYRLYFHWFETREVMKQQLIKFLEEKEHEQRIQSIYIK